MKKKSIVFPSKLTLRKQMNEKYQNITNLNTAQEVYETANPSKTTYQRIKMSFDNLQPEIKLHIIAGLYYDVTPGPFQDVPSSIRDRQWVTMTSSAKALGVLHAVNKEMRDLVAAFTEEIKEDLPFQMVRLSGLGVAPPISVDRFPLQLMYFSACNVLTQLVSHLYNWMHHFDALYLGECIRREDQHTIDEWNHAYGHMPRTHEIRSYDLVSLMFNIQKESRSTGLAVDLETSMHIGTNVLASMWAHLLHHPELIPLGLFKYHGSNHCLQEYLHAYPLFVLKLAWITTFEKIASTFTPQKPDEMDWNDVLDYASALKKMPFSLKDVELARALVQTSDTWDCASLCDTEVLCNFSLHAIDYLKCQSRLFLTEVHTQVEQKQPVYFLGLLKSSVLHAFDMDVLERFMQGDVNDRQDTGDSVSHTTSFFDRGYTVKHMYDERYYWDLHLEFLKTVWSERWDRSGICDHMRALLQCDITLFFDYLMKRNLYLARSRSFHKCSTLDGEHNDISYDYFHVTPQSITRASSHVGENAWRVKHPTFVSLPDGDVCELVVNVYQ